MQTATWEPPFTVADWENKTPKWRATMEACWKRSAEVWGSAEGQEVLRKVRIHKACVAFCQLTDSEQKAFLQACGKTSPLGSP